MIWVHWTWDKQTIEKQKYCCKVQNRQQNWWNFGKQVPKKLDCQFRREEKQKKKKWTADSKFTLVLYLPCIPINAVTKSMTGKVQQIEFLFPHSFCTPCRYSYIPRISHVIKGSRHLICQTQLSRPIQNPSTTNPIFNARYSVRLLRRICHVDFLHYTFRYTAWARNIN